jgi:hypothetical protein
VLKFVVALSFMAHSSYQKPVGSNKQCAMSQSAVFMKLYKLWENTCPRFFFVFFFLLLLHIFIIPEECIVLQFVNIELILLLSRLAFMLGHCFYNFTQSETFFAAFVSVTCY